jgi:hypothetical protein
VSPVKYELEFYIPKYDILYSNRRENLKPYIAVIFLRIKARPKRKSDYLTSICYAMQSLIVPQPYRSLRPVISAVTAVESAVPL